MKIYDKEEINKLYEYKENLEDEEIKEMIANFIMNYNLMYLRYKDYIKDKERRKSMYDEIERLSVENANLKETNDRKTIIIKNLKEELRKRKGE